MRSKKSLSCLFFHIIFLLKTAVLLGQTSREGDSLNASVYQAKLSANILIGENSSLYNGREYTEVSKKIIGDPLFLHKDFVTGEVKYSGVLYSNVPLFYDLYQDELITKHMNRIFKIQLVKEKVEYFKISEHYFINATKLKYVQLNGFYEVVLDEEIKVLMKRTKRLDEQSGASEIQRTLKDKTQYFIIHNKDLFEITSKKSLKAAFPGFKNDISKWIHKSNMNFNKSKQQSIIYVAQKILEQQK